MSDVLDMPTGKCSPEVTPKNGVATNPYKVGKVDLHAIEDYVRAILVAVVEEPDRPGLRDTPRRVA